MCEGVCFGFRKKLTPKSQVALVAFSIELKAQQAGAFYRVLLFFQRTFRLYCLFHQRKVTKYLRKRLQEFVLIHDPANIKQPQTFRCLALITVYKCPRDPQFLQLKSMMLMGPVQKVLRVWGHQICVKNCKSIP